MQVATKASETAMGILDWYNCVQFNSFTVSTTAEAMDASTGGADSASLHQVIAEVCCIEGSFCAFVGFPLSAASMLDC